MLLHDSHQYILSFISSLEFSESITLSKLVLLIKSIYIKLSMASKISKVLYNNSYNRTSRRDGF